MRIGKKARSRLGEAAAGMAAQDFDAIQQAQGISFARPQAVPLQGGGRQKGETLIVGHGGLVDDRAIRPRQRGVKAVGAAVTAFQILQAQSSDLAPGAVPPQRPGSGEDEALAALDAGPARRGYGKPVLPQQFLEPALGPIHARIGPKRQGMAGQPVPIEAPPVRRHVRIRPAPDTVAPGLFPLRPQAGRRDQHSSIFPSRWFPA